MNIESIALVGPPNSGKTTLFNWLTGRRQKVVNYPGSTVDITCGPMLENLMPKIEGDSSYQFIDTPGTYSLFPKSPDEEVTVKTLYDSAYKIEKVVLVLDSTQLNRQWHLLRQLQEANFNVVVAVTMHDLHTKEKSEVNLQELARWAKVPVCPIDGTTGWGAPQLVSAVLNSSREKSQPTKLNTWNYNKLQQVFAEGEQVTKAVTNKKLNIFSLTEARDKVLLNPLWGILIFALIMFTLFSSIYWLAAPLMDQVDNFFGFLNEYSRTFLGEGLWGQLISDGVVGGIGSVMVFVPQIFILFIGISLLEDSGYLARAATLIDKPLSKLGLNGKAFVPLLSGFACAVPAMMAARSINSKKEKWIAMFIIPFMTCSARLPVYALLITFLFVNEPLKAGAMMAIMYMGAIFTGAIAAAILNKIIKEKSPGFFLMELPLYRQPKLKVVLRNSIKRTKAYVFKTGPIILVLSIVIWVLSTFPNYNEANHHVRLQSSFAAQAGQVLEPLFKPLGVDWRAGVGLLTAFAAREVFVSSLAVMFNVAESDSDETLQAGLIENMKKATMADGTPVFTVASVASLLVFFMIALQCISTSATAKQEMRSNSFVWVQLISMNLLAYVAAALTHYALA